MPAVRDRRLALGVRAHDNRRHADGDGTFRARPCPVGRRRHDPPPRGTPAGKARAGPGLSRTRLAPELAHDRQPLDDTNDRRGNRSRRDVRRVDTALALTATPSGAVEVAAGGCGHAMFHGPPSLARCDDESGDGSTRPAIARHEPREGRVARAPAPQVEPRPPPPSLWRSTRSRLIPLDRTSGWGTVELRCERRPDSHRLRGVTRASSAPVSPQAHGRAAGGESDGRP